MKLYLLQHERMTSVLVMVGIVSIGLFSFVDEAEGIILANNATNSTTVCNSDCFSPTLGIIDNGNLYVENGFSYNGNPVDVNSFFTPYPLITVDVGRENLASFKVYDERGPQSVSHFALAFGIGQGKIFSDSKTIIEWDKSWNGQETLNVIDPENSLDNVKVVTSTGSCKNVLFGTDCLIIDIYHTFRQQLDFNIVGTYYWDANRNAANNYFNDGIEIIGDSLNPPNQYVVIHKGNQMTITEIEKNVGLDQDGNLWTYDSYWKMDYQPQGKIDDGITSQGIDRNSVRFSSYKQGQILLAEHQLQTSVDGSLIKTKILEESKPYDYDFKTRSNNIELQNRMASELNRANDLFENRFVVDEQSEFKKYWEIYRQFQEQSSK